MSLASAKSLAPQTPACFPDRLQWVAYLLHCQNEDQIKPFLGGQYKPAYNFCKDCTLERTTRMSRLGQCDPSQFRRHAPTKRPAHVG